MSAAPVYDPSTYHWPDYRGETMQYVDLGVRLAFVWIMGPPNGSDRAGELAAVGDRYIDAPTETSSSYYSVEKNSPSVAWKPSGQISGTADEPNSGGIYGIGKCATPSTLAYAQDGSVYSSLHVNSDLKKFKYRLPLAWQFGNMFVFPGYHYDHLRFAFFDIDETAASTAGVSVIKWLSDHGSNIDSVFAQRNFGYTPNNTATNTAKSSGLYGTFDVHQRYRRSRGFNTSLSQR